MQTDAQVNAIMRHIRPHDLTIFTIINPELRASLKSKLEKQGAYHFNVLGPLLRILAQFLGIQPQYEVGLLQRIDADYFRRIEAIPFTMEHDDGRGERLDKADIILVGPSRCSKTPLSMYLATMESRYVANIPLINEVTELGRVRKLLAPFRKKVVGLYLDPMELTHLREARTKNLVANGHVPHGLEDYYGLQPIQREITACRRLYEQEDWPSINATHRGIEEIGREVLQVLHLRAVHEETWT